jgi:hypothetical protein
LPSSVSVEAGLAASRGSFALVIVPSAERMAAALRDRLGGRRARLALPGIAVRICIRGGRPGLQPESAGSAETIRPCLFAGCCGHLLRAFGAGGRFFDGEVGRLDLDLEIVGRSDAIAGEEKTVASAMRGV